MSGDQPVLPFGQNAEVSSERLLTPQDLADYLDVPLKTVYNWRHHDTGPQGLRVGRHLRFRWCDVQAWVADRIAEED